MLQQKNNWILKLWQVPPVKVHFLNFMEFVVMSENAWSPYKTIDPDA